MGGGGFLVCSCVVVGDLAPHDGARPWPYMALASLPRSVAMLWGKSSEKSHGQPGQRVPCPHRITHSCTLSTRLPSACHYACHLDHESPICGRCGKCYGMQRDGRIDSCGRACGLVGGALVALAGRWLVPYVVVLISGGAALVVGGVCKSWRVCNTA